MLIPQFSNYYSGSAAAAIKLRKESSGLIVQIRDLFRFAIMGREYPEEKQQELMTSGLGCGGMRERLRQLGGTWKYNPMEPEPRLARFSKPRDHLVSRRWVRCIYPFGIV
jgi:hypothetical protein